jgi:hypothetical protein
VPPTSRVSRDPKLFLLVAGMRLPSRRKLS